jgi:hypothetical protein
MTTAMIFRLLSTDTQAGHLANAAKATSSGNSLLTQVLFLIAGGIFGAACTYAASRLSARHDPHKQLSWDADTDRGLIAVGPQIRDNVKISYKGEEADDLVAIRCHVRNTGNQVVKNQKLRFSFPEGTKILEAGFRPAPEPELLSSQLALDPTRAWDRSFMIGHIEASQEVSFEFIAAGPRADGWTVHPFNEDGGVVFQQREVNRIRDEQEHIAPFVVFLTSLVAFSALIPSLENTNFFINDFVAAVGLLGQVLLIALLAPHIIPVTKIIRRLIDRKLSSQDAATSVQVFGGAPRIVTSSGTIATGGVHFDANQSQ